MAVNIWKTYKAVIMAKKDRKDREEKNVICCSANIINSVLYDHLVHQTAYNFRNYFLTVQFWEKYTR